MQTNLLVARKDFLPASLISIEPAKNIQRVKCILCKLLMFSFPCPLCDFVFVQQIMLTSSLNSHHSSFLANPSKCTCWRAAPYKHFKAVSFISVQQRTHSHPTFAMSLCSTENFFLAQIPPAKPLELIYTKEGLCKKCCQHIALNAKYFHRPTYGMLKHSRMRSEGLTNPKPLFQSQYKAFFNSQVCNTYWKEFNELKGFSI